MEWIQTISAAVSLGLSQVPNVLWAALIAAGVAFVTTTLSNRNSRKQLRMQLDAAERREKIEREMALRRDVYLPAVEAITRAHSSLGRLTDVNVDQTLIGQQMTTDLATMAKVQLIAGDATVQALMAFTKALMPAFFEVLTLRAPLMIRKHSIELEQTYADAKMAEHRRLAQLMKEHDLAGSTDRPALERLDRQCKRELELFQMHAGKQATLWQEQNTAVFALIKRLAQLTQPIAATIPNALLAARRELDLPLDEAAFRKLYAEQQESAKSAVLAIEDNLKRVIPPPP